VRLGPPLSTIVNLGMTVFSVIVYIYIFSYADTYAPHFNLAYLDDVPEPYRSILKNLERIVFITFVLVVMFYQWYTDYHRMSNLRYAVIYAYEVVFFMLIARAINRRAPGFEQQINK